MEKTWGPEKEIKLIVNLGKPYQDALDGDLPESITTIRYYAGWGR